MIDLVGEWEFQGSTLTDSQGQMLEDPMAKGTGILMYTATGYMAVQLIAPTASIGKEEVKLTHPYIAYYGKYIFDAATQQVTHNVINSNILALARAKVIRRFKHEGPGIMSLQNIEAETFGIDRPVFRKLFWRLIKE